MQIPANILDTLTEEQKRKVEAARTPEELLAIAQEAGHELSPDQLEAVAGGKWCPFYSCHKVCGTFHGCSGVCLANKS